MWTRVLLTAAVAVAVVFARPSSIYNYKSDSLSHKMSGIPGKAVTGGYSWTAPNGQQFSVNYIADKQGYRVLNSHNSFPKTERFPPQHRAKPVSEVQTYSAAETSALRVPETPKPQAFSRTQKTFAAPVFASQDKAALARSHFGLPSSSGADTIPKITTTTTRRPVTVIFFNTTPKPTTTFKPVVPDNKIYHPHQVKETAVPESAPETVPAPVVAKVVVEKTVDVALKSEKSVASETKDSKTEAAPAEAEAEAEAEGAEAEGAEAEGAEAEGAEAEAEGEEGGEGEEEGAEGAEEEGEGAEEEESESNSEAEEW